MQVHFIRARSGSPTHPKAHKLTSEPKNRLKKAKIGENRRSAQVCGPPGPENAGPRPTLAGKKWRENNGFIQSSSIYMSIFIQYFISVPSWSRGFTPAYHTEGLRFKTRLGQKKSFSFFSIFSWTQPKYQQNPKLIFEICTLFLTEKINFAYKCNKKAIKTSKSYVLKIFLLWHIYLAFCSYVS